MVMAAADQILVSGGPLLVVLAGGSTKEAGMVFAATMLVRAPVFLFQGFAAALLPSLTTFRANGDRERFRSAVARTAGVLAGFAGLMTLGALALGPALMGALYGPGFGAARIDLAILSAGVGCYLAASTFSQAALAQGATARAAAAWSASAVTFVVLELVLSGSALTRVSIAFAVAAALNAALCIVLVVRPERHAAKATRVRPTPKLAKS
jgi:O-antigen/teichoic acid export membrane protein